MSETLQMALALFAVFGAAGAIGLSAAAAIDGELVGGVIFWILGLITAAAMISHYYLGWW
ncbi:MAG: hypothetical protein Q7S95_02160 [bacterium]|nr:hypothetical protein [bacterium]